MKKELGEKRIADKDCQDKNQFMEELSETKDLVEEKRELRRRRWPEGRKVLHSESEGMKGNMDEEEGRTKIRWE